MKVRVLLDEQGKPVAIERTIHGAAPRGKDEWHAELIEPKGHKFHEVDLPDDFEKIEDAQDFYTRAQPHIARIKR